jgi:hypothetical protein
MDSRGSVCAVRIALALAVALVGCGGNGGGTGRRVGDGGAAGDEEANG